MISFYDLFALTIEAASDLAIIYYCFRAFALLFSDRSAIRKARIVVGRGILAALGLKVSATLLKLLLIHNWQGLGVAAVILALRTIVKLELKWQGEYLLNSQGPFRYPTLKV